MAQAMAKSATDLIERKYKDVPIQIEAMKEPQHAAVGNGSGIM